jgi:DNA-binding MarR family transcriptional regulator
MHGEIMPHALEIEARLFAVLDDRERASLKDMLARLSAKVRELETTENTA